ncbi:glycosyltransferase family 4 protein [soil metagenome]
MKWWNSPEKDRQEHGVHLHAICPLYALYDGERRSIKQGILFGLHCLKLIREDWDVIDVDHMPFFPIIFTKIVCVLKHRKMSATWHEVWGRDYWVKYMGWKGNIAYIIERVSSLLPNTIVSVSELTTKLLSTSLNRDKHVTTIYSGIDIDTINKIPPHSITSDIMYTGRLLTHKNVDLMIEAVSLLKKQGQHITCIIVGDGPEKENLINLAKKRGVAEHVVFYDFFPAHEDVLGLMKSSKVFVFPSEREGFGLVALEANACGIPFCTLNHTNNAAKYLIKSDNGSMFDHNAKSLAGSIGKHVQQKTDAKKYINAAKEYDWTKTINDLLHVYLL